MCITRDARKVTVKNEVQSSSFSWSLERYDNLKVEPFKPNLLQPETARDQISLIPYAQKFVSHSGETQHVDRAAVAL